MHQLDSRDASFRQSQFRIPNHSRQVVLLLAVTSAFGLATTSNTFGEVKVDRLFPPAVSVGVSTVVTAEGKFDVWPAQVWCDRADVTVTPDKDSGKWVVVTAADAPAGVAWLRFYDDTSASPLLPLLVEPVAVIAEVEPNNGPEKATRIDLPAVCFGKLEKSGDVDCFAISATQGQTLVASVMANRVLNSPMDTVLQLVDRRGNVLAQNDDGRGIDSQIVFTVPQDGEYVLRLFAFPLVPNSTIGFAGGADFVYRIGVTAVAAIDHSLPLVEPAGGVPGDFQPAVFGWSLPDNPAVKTVPAGDVSPAIVSVDGAIGWQSRPAVPGLIDPLIIDLTRGEPTSTGDAATDWTLLERLPAIVSGRIERAGQVVKLRVAVPPGKKHRATVYSQSSHLQLDSVITVVDPESGKQLARNDDAAASVRDAAVDFTAEGKSEPVTVEIQVSDLVGGSGIGHGFSLVIVPQEPSVAITVDAGQYKIVSGASLEIPVKIARADGFALPLRIRADGLPDGVTGAEIVSEPKGDSAKEVKLKLDAAAVEAVATRHATIRIVASAVPPADAADAAEQTELAEAGYQVRPGFKSSKLWLTVTDAKPAK